MPDIKQSLRDFVATSNSGKYSDEKVLLSKFPELKGYDVNSLKDFVATSNSGKYADENELFSKFPEFKIGAQPKAVQPPAKKKSLVSRSPWEGIIPSVESSVKTEQQPAASSSVKKAEAPVDLNKGTEKGEIYKGLPIKGFEDKTYVLKNVDGVDVWQEYNTKNKDVVIGKANKYLSLSKEGVAEGGFSGGEKQKNAKLALTQLAGKLGVKVSSFDGPDDIYQKIQSSKELGETYKNITDPTRIKTLNQHFKAQASTNEGVQTYVGYPEKGKEDNEYRISKLPITKEQVWEVKRKGQKEFTVISDEGSINALNNWTGNKVEPNDDAKAKRDAQIARQESAINSFKLVNSKMFDLAEEDAVPYLQKMYGKYGFNFYESGEFGKDEVTVTSSRGGEPITFSLDNWSEGANASESAKLRRWMIENQSTGDYIDKEREAVKQAEDNYRNSKYEQEKLTPEQIKLQSTSDLQRPIISNPLDAKNKLSAPAEFKQEIAANTIMTNKINAQRRLSDLSNSAKTQKQKDEVATIAVANQNVLKQEADVQATYLNDLSKQNKQLNNSVLKLKQDSERFYNRLKQQGITPEQLNTDPELLRQKQELDERAKSIESVSKNLSADMSAVKALNKENEKNAGLYIAFNENRGNVMGGLVNSVLKGVGALPDAILNNISGGDDNFASNALISLLGSDYTTEEFMKSEDRWDLTKAAFGGVESLGAMATGSGLGKIVGGGTKLMALSEELPFFALSYNELKSEMKGPEWDGATTAEKEGLALIYAYINGKLEKLGTDALIDTGKISKDVSKNLILKTIAGLKPGATTEAMDLALQTNFKKFILSSAYTLGKDFASEAKTGAMQELTGITLKNTYNLIKGKEMFKEVPNTIADITDAVISGAYMEGLGGLAFSMPKVAVDAGKFGYSKAFKDPEKLAFAEKIFNDSDMRVMILNDLKTKIASGEITKEEGQERVDAINNTVSLFEKLPDGLREEDKPKTLDLLVEKSKLEQEIRGKDEALIVPQKERITEINNELTNISKNATKEGNITESNLTERENGNEGGKTAETSGSDSTIESGENQKEVEKLRADEQTELSEAIPNIDDYKVDGKVDREKIMASEDGAKYNEIYDKYDKLITPLLPKEKIAVFRGIGNNVMDSDNSSTLWVAEDEEVAKNYAGTSDDGKLNVESLEVEKPSNPIEMPYKLATDVRGSGIADNLRSVAADLTKSGKLKGENISKALELISDFESKAGENLELFTTKMNKPEASEAFSKAIQALGFDGILQKESASRDGAKSNTYGILKTKYPILLESTTQAKKQSNEQKTILNKTDEEIEKRMSEIEEIHNGIPSQFQSESDLKEYNALEKEMEKRERDSVFNIPLEKVNESVDALIKKEKEMPNGFGSFIEKRDARETKEVAERYLSPDKLSNKEVMDDFSDALRGNPTTWYADGLKLRESANEASKRGISFEDLLKKVKTIYTSEGYSEQESEDVVKMFIKPIFEGAKEIKASEKKSIEKTEQPTTLEEVKSLDTKDKTKLKRVDDYLANLEKGLDDFGKETLGMNLGVAAAKKMIQAVRILVKAGMSLEQAIKSYAKDNDISEKDIVDTIEAVQNKQKESEASKVAKNISKKDNTKVTVTERVALKDQLRMEAKAARDSAMNIKKKQRALADSIKAMAKAGKITASQSANLLRKLSNLNVDNEDTTQEFLDYADRLFANAEYSDKVDKGFKAKAKIKAKLKSKNQAPVTQVAKEFATIDPSLVTDIDKYNEMADAMLAAISPSVSGVKQVDEIAKINEAEQAELKAQIPNIDSYKTNGKVDVDKITDADERATYDEIREKYKKLKYEANNKLKTPINIADVQSYVEKALKAQKEIERQSLLSYYKKLVDAGILNDKMSIEEIREVVANENNDDDKLTAKERAKIVMDDLKERFAVAKSAIEDILNEKVNVERDEEIDALNDDETYTIIDTSTGDVPDFLKDSVSSSVKTTVRKGLFGKKKSFEKTKIVLTGKQIKEKYYSFEKQNENISESDREIIKRLMSLDITDMKIKDAMALVDAANNFIENGITAGLRNEVPLQEGNVLMKDLANKGFVAKSIGFLRGLNLTKIKGFGKIVNTLGKAYATQIMSITAMADTLFGQKKGVEFLEKIGFQKLSQGVAKAKTIGNKIINSYVKEFGKTKPNGQRFNTPFNTYERGVYASLARTVFGTDADKKAEFDRKLKELKNSAEKLIQSNEPNLMRKGNMYNEIIEKLGLNGDNVTIDTVIKNADAKNVEAVDWWINEWQQHYSDLYDTSLGVYNVMLNKDENYTPDRFSKIDQSNKEGDLGEDEGGAFATSMNLEKSKSGVLMESKKKPSGENRYLDIDFDSNNKAALDEALIDIYTAEAIRQIRGAVKSEAFKKVIPESDVRQRFVDKVDRYIKIKKGKGELQDEDARKLERAISLVSKYATGRVLGSMASFPAQSIPPLLNTLINARRLDFRDSFNPDAIQWMIDNGASPSIRGLESLDNIKRVNEKGLRQAGSTFDAILSGAENVSDFWLNQFLVRGDKYAATASWLTYYKQSLKKQKENTDIDWNNHKVNKDAFAYANYMVDKNQNPSDSDATGQIFSSQKPVTRVLRNIFIPFSGFSMNQKVKLHSDTVNFFRKGSTVESLSSLTATTAEIVAFHFIKVSIQLYLYKLAINALMGDEDDEEYQKAKKELIKNAAKQTIQDFASPAPIFDFLTIKGANAIIDKVVESELTENNESEIKDAYEKDKESRILKKQKEISYDDFKADYIKTEVEKSQFYLPQEEMFGGTVATAIKTSQLTMDMYELAVNKKIAFKNPDGTYTYKEASDDAVKAGKWGLIAMLAHQAGALPGDAASMSRMILKRAKPTAVRTNIKEVADTFKKDLGLKELTQYQKDMIKNGASLDKMIENEYKISLAGGLNTKKKQDDFAKIKSIFGSNLSIITTVSSINNNKSVSSIIQSMKDRILNVNEIKNKTSEAKDKVKEIKKEAMIEVIKNSRK